MLILLHKVTSVCICVVVLIIHNQLMLWFNAGPMPETVEDFWQMIWDQKIKTIVMLTKLMEGDKPKCEQYWPENVGDSINPKPSLVVTYVDLQMFADYKFRTIQVKSVRILLFKKGCAFAIVVA